MIRIFAGLLLSLAVVGCAAHPDLVVVEKADFASSGKGAFSFSVAMDDKRCGPSNAEFVSIDDRSNIVRVVTYTTTDLATAKPGRYFLSKINCNFYPEKHVVALDIVADPNTPVIPKGTPIITITAGEISDVGTFRIVTTSRRPPGLYFFQGPKSSAVVRAEPSDAERLGYLHNWYPTLRGRFVSRLVVYHDLNS